MRWTAILALAAILPVAGFQPVTAHSIVSLAVGQGDASALLHLPPDDDRPAPIVLLLPDGPMPDLRDDRYIEHLIWAGIAVLEPQAEQPDIAALIAAASRVIGVDASRMALLARGAGARLETGPVRAAVLLYPGCNAALPAPQASRVLLVHGSIDAANPPAACRSVVEAWRMTGLRVRHLVLDDAGYAFDYQTLGPDSRVSLPRPDSLGRIIAIPWPETSEFAAQQAARFLAQELGLTP